jgi:hypothetical protein
VWQPWRLPPSAGVLQAQDARVRVIAYVKSLVVNLFRGGRCKKYGYSACKGQIESVRFEKILHSHFASKMLFFALFALIYPRYFSKLNHLLTELGVVRSMN